MKIDITECYVEGYLTFSHKVQRLLHEELSSLVDVSAAFSKKYSSEYMLVLWICTKERTTESVIMGPDVHKKDKRVAFYFHLPFDVILRADDGPRCALRFFFAGVRTVLGRYEMDTTKLDANEERIIDAICSNPEMFGDEDEDEPWPTLANYKPPPPRTEDPTRPAFKRLYKRIDGVLYYEAVGAHEGVAFHRAGKVGHKGKTKELRYNREAPKKAVETFLGVAVAKGFTEMPLEHEIEIQYAIEGMGTPVDFEKLSALEDHLHDLLGELGLGVCNENSIGGGTMEVFCFVVDADIAMKCIKKSLKGTRFADYTTIHVVEHDEEEDEE